MKYRILVNIFPISFLTYVLVSATGCTSDNKKVQDILNGGSKIGQNDTNVVALRVSKIQSIFKKAPGAVERVQLIKKANAKYDVSFPNNPDNLSKYTSVKGQALNLGVYGADLAYAGIYEQKEDASLYLQCANKIATSLGIPQAFNDAVVSRIEANIGVQDSLLSIITQDYMSTDAVLTKDSRPQVSAMIIAGGWVEGFYIATQMATQTKSPDVASTMVGQKSALDDLIALVQTYSSDAKMQDLLTQLKKIQAALAPIQVITGQPTTVTAEQVKAITAAVTDVRNEITSEF